MKTESGRYKWVVLGVTMLVNATIQLLWISYAPVTSLAGTFYGVDELAVGMFSMSFMIAFLPLSLPASWLIDTRGVRLSLGLGAVLAGVFGVVRGLAGPSYVVAIAATVVLAAVQPFFLN